MKYKWNRNVSLKSDVNFCSYFQRHFLSISLQVINRLHPVGIVHTWLISLGIYICKKACCPHKPAPEPVTDRFSDLVKIKKIVRNII